MKLNDNVAAGVYFIVIMGMILGIAVHTATPATAQIQPNVLPFPSVTVMNSTVNVVAGTTELVSAYTASIPILYDRSTWFIMGQVYIIPGSDATAIMCGIRRGTTISSTQVGTFTNTTITAGAYKRFTCNIMVTDTLTYGGYVAYCVTVEQYGGSASGTKLQATIAAFELT